MHKCGEIKTHMLPAELLVRALISTVVTFEEGYSTARHLDTHGILHYCESKSTRVRVGERERQTENACVFVRCPLGVGGDDIKGS